jgi:hypothetical protein
MEEEKKSDAKKELVEEKRQEEIKEEMNTRRRGKQEKQIMDKKESKKMRKTSEKESELEEVKEEKDYDKEVKREDEIKGDRISNKNKKYQERQIIAIFIGIVLVFSAFLIPYYYFKNQRIFEYEEFLWQVDKGNEVTFYHTQVNKTLEGRFLGVHNIYFRNDPRRNNIPIEVSEYSFYKNIIITSSPEVLKCEKQILVTDALAQITLAMPYYNKEVRTAVNDMEEANKTKQLYATCENKPEKTTIIQVEMGDKAKIMQDLDNRCYRIVIDDCNNNLLVAERFILEILKRLI